jgi:hypothetical protein
MKKIIGLLICLYCVFFLFKPPIVSAQNMILNSSFELWLDSLGVRMPFGWYTSEASDSGSAVRTTDMHSGIYALKLTGGDTMAYAMTITYCQAGHNYYFSGWAKSPSYIAGSFIITWLKLSQQPIMNPVIIPILLHTSYYNFTQIVQAPDSAILVNVDVVALPGVTLFADDVTLQDTVLAGIEENRSSPFASRQALKIYPNPAKSIIYISSPSSINQIELFDATGKIIRKINSSDLCNISLDIRHLKDGIYFVQTSTTDKKIMQKLVIQK